MSKAAVIGAIKDTVGELIESGQQQASQISPKQIANTALHQVKSPEIKGTNPIASDKPPMFANDSQVDPQTLAKMQENDVLERKEGLTKTRKQLARMVIGRYQEMQQRILQESKEREGREKGHQLATYEAGKPGAAETVEQQQEMVAKAKKEEKPLAEPLLPSSTSSLPGLDAMQRSQTQAERKLGKVG